MKYTSSENHKQLKSVVFFAIDIARMLWVKAKKVLKVFPPTYFIGKTIKDGWKRRHVLWKVLKYIQLTAFKKAVILQSPLHGNVGDQAIIVAELEMLRRLRIPCADYPWTQGIEKTIARFTPGRCIVLQHGGGYLGQLWFKEEKRFRATIRSFKNNRIIVFPQTVYFDMGSEEGRRCLEQSKEIYQSHPNLTVFVREQFSYDFLKEYMPDLRVQLVPDIVMLLDPFHGNATYDRNGILLCLRNDREKTTTSYMRERLMKLLEENGQEITVTDMVIEGNIDIQYRKQILDAKLLEFIKSSVAITDRLHGMIFAAITETPCIVLDCLSPKIRGCYEWIKDLDYIRFTENIEEIPQIIEELKETKPQYNRKKIEEAMKPLYEVLINATK